MTLPPNLAHHIRVYLTGAEVDLQTVSAKQIRTKLATIYPDLDIKALRSEIDAISIPIFHEIKENFEAAARAAENKQTAGAVNFKQENKPFPLGAANIKQESRPFAVGAANGRPESKPFTAGAVNIQENKPSASSLALPPRVIPGGVSSASNNASVDHKPHSSGTPTTSQQKNPKPASSKTKKRKSAAYVDTDDEDGPGDGAGGMKTRSKKPKVPRKPRPEGEAAASNKGIHVLLNCSTPLSELIGVPMCSRPQVVKKIWEYIKNRGLQDPKDRREIICDEAMKKVFNQNSVNMFKMNKILADHLYKTEEAIQKRPECLPETAKAEV